MPIYICIIYWPYSDARYFFGCIHVVSVLLSFVSIWSSSVVFNDVEASEMDPDRCCSRKITGKLIFGIPYFFFTLVFRALGLALLICFLRTWSGIIIFGLFFINVLTALFIGDDFYRSCAYGIWSLFVPVGYTRLEWFSHFIYNKMKTKLSISILKIELQNWLQRYQISFKTVQYYQMIFVFIPEIQVHIWATQKCQCPLKRFYHQLTKKLNVQVNEPNTF